MDRLLLKKLGNIDQIAGIRESVLMRGRGEGTKTAEVYNASGLRFTVMPDRCMDIYDLSFKGVNYSFHSKNGIISPLSFSPSADEFPEQWSGGMLCTCGLSNVNLHSIIDNEAHPTHGRISFVPASNFEAESFWEGDDYKLRVSGEMHETVMFGRHFSLRRTIETGLYDTSVTITDVITNMGAFDEPYMLLYHMNFGSPFISPDTECIIPEGKIKPLSENSVDSVHIEPPDDGYEAQKFLITGLRKAGHAELVNKKLRMRAELSFTADNLPYLVEWKHLKSHDYCLALEPTNAPAVNRKDAIKNGKIAVIPAYSSVKNKLILSVSELK